MVKNLLNKLLTKKLNVKNFDDIENFDGIELVNPPERIFISTLDNTTSLRDRLGEQSHEYKARYLVYGADNQEELVEKLINEIRREMVEGDVTYREEEWSRMARGIKYD